MKRQTAATGISSKQHQPAYRGSTHCSLAIAIVAANYELAKEQAILAVYAGPAATRCWAEALDQDEMLSRVMQEESQNYPELDDNAGASVSSPPSRTAGIRTEDNKEAEVGDADKNNRRHPAALSSVFGVHAQMSRFKAVAAAAAARRFQPSTVFSSRRHANQHIAQLTGLVESLAADRCGGAETSGQARHTRGDP